MEARTDRPLADQPDTVILAKAVPIMDNLMEASTRLDYARHVRDFSERARAALSERQFRQVCEQYQREKGFFSERELLGILRRPRSVIVVWKQKFSKAPGEYLAELVLVEEDGRVLIERVMVT